MTDEIARFACTDDPTPEATDAEMATLFGPNWQQMTYGEQWAKLNELLKPHNQAFDGPAAGCPAMRHILHPVHSVWFWSSTRQTAKYVLSTEPPKAKQAA